MSLIITETQDAIGTIVMNHTAKRNALSEALINEITVVLDAFHEQGIRAVVLRAPAGSKVWSRIRAASRLSPLPSSMMVGNMCRTNYAGSGQATVTVLVFFA